MEADKIARFFGSSGAGFSQAQQWAHSSDPALRAKTVDVFQDIKSSAAKAALESMRRDPSAFVADKVENALQQN